MIDYNKLKKMSRTVKAKEIAEVWGKHVESVRRKLKEENLPQMSLAEFEELCTLMQESPLSFFESQ